jgi:hypothetical protein
MERARQSVPGDVTLLAVIGFGVLLLHVVAGAQLLSGSADLVTPQEQASVSSAD